MRTGVPIPQLRSQPCSDLRGFAGREGVTRAAPRAVARASPSTDVRGRRPSCAPSATGRRRGNDSSSASSSWRSTSARLSRLCAFTGSFMLEPLERASPAGCGKSFLHQRAELGQILGHEKLSVHYVIVSKDERRHYLVERRGFKP